MALIWREHNQKGPPAVVNSGELSLLPREDVKSLWLTKTKRVISAGESTHRTELLVKMITSGYGKKDWLVKGKINRHF